MSQNPKRKKSGQSDELTGREKKKLRIAEARTIAVQPVAGGSLSQPVAGPSRIVPINSMPGLPSAIDVEKFVEARAFEIDAMQTAMKTASAGSTQRAWQALPRHLRRRAASHDVRRVPVRLRARARAEMDALPKKTSSLPKRGKLKALPRTEALLNRQRDKAWLETHIWHAKRMRMDNMWGFRLAVQPTEKSYRPSHRASVQGSIIHDASYFSLVELRGTEKALIRTLALCCDPQGAGPSSKRFLSGGRTLETHLYQPGGYPCGLISPISIMWRPEDLNPPLSDAVRTIWLRFHPSVHDEVLAAMQLATSQFLKQYKEEGNNDEIEIHVTELKDQLNIFEIMGPNASRVLKGALSPVTRDHTDQFSEFWSSLADVQTSGSIPRNMVIGFKVNDPRLKFPPKMAKPKLKKPNAEQESAIHIFPSASLARSEIWNESTRLGLSRPKYQKKELDERRSKQLVPGTPLNPLRQDDRIPALLIQRSLEPHESTSGEALHGWTLIIPSGWGMAFWNSLTYTGTRVGGQRERQTQAYEAGSPYFPRDYPSIAAYDTFAKELEEELRSTWERKPPAKRVNFEKLDVSEPWSPNWRKILGLPTPIDEGLVSAQRDGGTAEGDSAISGQPWLLRGSELPNILQAVSQSLIPRDHLLGALNQIRARRSLDPLPSSKGESLLQSALLKVRVVMCLRGTPQDLALIYSMDDNEVAEALKTIQNPNRKQADNFLESEDEEPTPAEDRIIGRITTGHFSLARGGGFAIGTIPLKRWLQIKALTTSDSPLVKIRNVNSRLCRLARLKLLLEGPC